MEIFGKTELMTRRKAWAYALIRKFKGRPARYGSAEWLALEDGCAEKVAAVCVAAEAWASTGDTLEEDLRFEVEEMSRCHKALEDREFRQRAEEHERTWSHLGRLRLVADWRQPPKTPRPLEDIGRDYMARCEADRQSRERRAGDRDAG